MARRIAVVPAFNEERTVASILVKLHHLVDELVVVDDGSTDRTRAEIESVLPSLEHCRLLGFDENQGMSAAYYLAFTDLRRRMRTGELDGDDLVYTIDADGQHDLDVLDDLLNQMRDEKLDALLVRRDLSTYPIFKQVGNALLSWWATLWAGGVKLHDVESGYRIFRLGALSDALSYYRGHKYSETVEVAVVLSRLGHRVRNDILVPVPVYRSRTRMIDVVIDLAAIPMAALRVSTRKPPGVEVPGLAKPIAVSAGLAIGGVAVLLRLGGSYRRRGKRQRRPSDRQGAGRPWGSGGAAPQQAKSRPAIRDSARRAPNGSQCSQLSSAVGSRAGREGRRVLPG